MPVAPTKGDGKWTNNGEKDMRSNQWTQVATVNLLALFLVAAPAFAQGKSKGKAAKEGRPTLERVRDDDRDRDRDRDWERYERYEDDVYRSTARGNGAGKVPPGWCKGQGNPHNTVENCGYRSDDRRYDVYSDRNVYNDRISGSEYQRAHRDFHDYLDRKYGDLSSRAGLDLERQLQLRIDKRREHDDWHRRAGIAHE